MDECNDNDMFDQRSRYVCFPLQEKHSWSNRQTSLSFLSRTYTRKCRILPSFRAWMAQSRRKTRRAIHSKALNHFGRSCCSRNSFFPRLSLPDTSRSSRSQWSSSRITLLFPFLYSSLRPSFLYILDSLSLFIFMILGTFLIMLARVFLWQALHPSPSSLLSSSSVELALPLRLPLELRGLRGGSSSWAQWVEASGEAGPLSEKASYGCMYESEELSGSVGGESPIMLSIALKSTVVGCEGLKSSPKHGQVWP